MTFSHVPPQRYEIIVRGRLSRRHERVFDGVTAEARPGRTIVRADLVDGSPPYGLLERLRGLGLELISVNAIVQHGDVG